MAGKITASEQSSVSRLDQIYDGTTLPSEKWLSLQANALDGTYHPMPGAGSNIALGKPVTLGPGASPEGTSNNPAVVTDGSTVPPYLGVLPVNSLVYVQVDLEAIYRLDSIKVWHYYLDGRTYHNTKTEVSTDGQQWITVFDSAVDGEYVETPEGHKIALSGIEVRYIRDYVQGSSANGGNHWIEIQAYLASSYQVGWWGANPSDKDGYFGTEPTTFEMFHDVVDPSRYTGAGVVVNSFQQGGILDITTNSIDPQFNMYKLGSFDPNIARYIKLRYRVVSGVAGQCEVFFTNSAYTTANANQRIVTSLISDGEWHEALLDGWEHASWKSSNITGWRIDPAIASGVNIQIAGVSLIGVGAIPSVPTLNVDYGRQVSVHRLVVAGDLLLNEYPTDFTLTLYNGTQDVYKADVSGNLLPIWKIDLPKVYDITSAELIVSRVNKPGKTVKILELRDDPHLVRGDILRIASQADDSKYLGLGFNSPDSLTLDISERSSTVHHIKSTDTLSVGDSDSSFFTQYQIKRVDRLGISSTDFSSDIFNTHKRRDSLVLNVEEQRSIEASFGKADRLQVNRYIEGDDITVEFKQTDVLGITLQEVSKMRNIHTVMDDSFRAIYGKVEITYTDPFIDNDVTLEVSTVAPELDPLQVTDTREDPSYKWFSLLDNKLDGTYHPVDLPEYSVGWWGTIISDTEGNLPTPERLKVTFTKRTMYELFISGDKLLDDYPVDFDITLRYDDGSVAYEEQVRGNNSVYWQRTLETPLYEVAVQELVIYRINEANRTAKIVEFFAALKETYYSDQIVGIDLLEEQSFDDMTLPFGNVSSNELAVELHNFDDRFDPTNTESPLYGWIKKNRQIKAWLGAEVVPGEIEWYQLGKFWIQDWRTPESGVTTMITALDRLDLLNNTDFSISQVYTNMDLYTIAEIILFDANVPPEEYILDEKLRTITIPYLWFDRMSHREALVLVAQAALGRVYCDRFGNVVVTTTITTEQPVYVYDPDKNLIDIDRPLGLAQLKNQIEVIAKPRRIGAATEVFTSEEVIALEPGEVYQETITFTTIPAMNIQQPVIQASTGISATIKNTYAWGVVVEYRNDSSAAGTITRVSITGQPLEVVGQRTAVARNEKSIRDNGKQIYTLENDYIQSYQQAQVIADDILTTYSEPLSTTSIQTRGNIAIELGSHVLVPTKQGVLQPHYITRQNLNWEGSLDASVETQIIR